MLEYMCVYAYLRVSATSATRHLHVHVHRRGRMDIGRAFGSVHTRVCVSVRGRALAGCVCVHVRAFGGVCVRVYAFFVRARASACMCIRICAYALRACTCTYAFPCACTCVRVLRTCGIVHMCARASGKRLCSLFRYMRAYGRARGPGGRHDGELAWWRETGVCEGCFGGGKRVLMEACADGD